MEEKWLKTYIQILKLISTHSTCKRKQLGSIIIKENRIISMGFNGVFNKQKHCNELFNGDEENFYEKHGIFSKENEIHAETNAIGYAAKNGISVNDCIMIVSLSPCCSCAKAIISSGIKEVFFVELYDRDPRGIQLLLKNNIKCEQVEL